jgi:hypothetical protein
MKLRGNGPGDRREAKLTNLDIDDGLEVALSFAGGTAVTFTIDRDSDELALLLSFLSDVANTRLAELGIRDVVITDTYSWRDDEDDD